MKTDSGWSRARLALVGTQLVAYLATTLVPAHAFPSNPRVGDEASVGSGSLRADSPTGRLAELGSLLSQQLTGAVTGAASDMLNTLGTTQLDIDFDRHFKVRGGSLDLLVPLHDKKERLDFMQVGVRHLYDRTTINVGAGQRYFSGDWMLGLNGFLDIDPARNHRRLGLGVEAWRDHLKLAANSYLRLSDWKNSRLLEGFDERPANGFDVRAEGYLPFHPQLGARLAYEKYFGNRVDLFARDALRSSRQALTVGITYTPMPVLSFSVDRLHGAGQSDTRVGLQMNLQFDRSLKEQLDPSRMKSRRNLAGSRYDLVSRNNRIVMEYREQMKIRLPAEIKGLGRQTVPLQVSIESKKPLTQVVLRHDALTAAGGTVADLGGGKYAVTLPDYNPATANRYVISVVAYNVKGHRSQPASTRVTVTGPDIDVAQSSLAADPPVIKANGQDTSVLRIALRDHAGEPVTGMAALIEAVLDETAEAGTATANTQPVVLSGFTETDAETDAGTYTATLTAATRPGVARIAVRVAGVALGETDVRIVHDASGAHISQDDLTVDKHTIVANGADAATYTTVAKDAFGNPLPGISVNWTADIGTLSGASSTTNAAGVATIRLTSTVSGTAQVTAQVGAQAAVNAPALAMASDHVTAVIGQGDLTVDKATLTAGTTDTATYAAIVKDAHGNPLPNATVSWHTTLGQLAASSSTTNAAGIAVTALSSTAAGIAQVTARTGTQSAVQAPPVTIHADSGNAGIGAGDLTVDKLIIVANGVDVATYTAVVRDPFGNPVPNIPVSWSTNHGVLPGDSSLTDAVGVATIGLTSTVSGNAQVTAQAGVKAAVDAPMVAAHFDPATVRLSVATNKIKITGNGGDDAVLTATLTDAFGNPLADQTIIWFAPDGLLSSQGTVTGADGKARVTFNALRRVPSNIEADIQAIFGSVSQTQAITVRAVQQVGNRDYWTMYSDLNTSSEQVAIANCTAHGGGTVATRSDLSAFATNGGDFGRMSVSDEYGNWWYRLSGAWGSISGTFSSPVGREAVTGGTAYVCVK